jgi:GNAT superfamily N-acetyltransferase
MTVEIRRAQPRDLPAVRTVLARALADDPLMDWIFGTIPHRPSALALFLWQAIERYVLAGTAWLAIADGRAVGAAAWRVAGTDATGADAGDTLPGQHVLELMVGPEHAAVTRDGFGEMRELPEPEPSALLHLLGVDADRRGTGIGRALLAAGVDAAPPGFGAHLHTTLEENVRFYESCGFVHGGAVRLGDAGPMMHLLVRGAAAPG